MTSSGIKSKVATDAMASLLKTMLTGSGSGKDGMRRTGSFDDLSMGAGRDGKCSQIFLHWHNAISSAGAVLGVL